MNFEVLKIEKNCTKNFIEEKYKQSENDEFEAFEMINNYKYFEIIKYYLPIMQIFWKKNCKRWVTLLPNKILSENFFNEVLDKKCSITLIFFLDINRQKVYYDLIC